MNLAQSHFCGTVNIAVDRHAAQQHLRCTHPTSRPPISTSIHFTSLSLRSSFEQFESSFIQRRSIRNGRRIYNNKITTFQTSVHWTVHWLMVAHCTEYKSADNVARCTLVGGGTFLSYSRDSRKLYYRRRLWFGASRIAVRPVAAISRYCLLSKRPKNNPNTLKEKETL
jgi:hypothetical protein